MPDSFHGYTVSEFESYNGSTVMEQASVYDKSGEMIGSIYCYGGHDLRVDPELDVDIPVPDVPTALSLLAQLDCVIAAAGNLPLAITAFQALQSNTE